MVPSKRYKCYIMCWKYLQGFIYRLVYTYIFIRMFTTLSFSRRYLPPAHYGFMAAVWKPVVAPMIWWGERIQERRNQFNSITGKKSSLGGEVERWSEGVYCVLGDPRECLLGGAGCHLLLLCRGLRLSGLGCRCLRTNDWGVRTRSQASVHGANPDLSLRCSKCCAWSP